ncbi:hypothetical protein CH063_12300 [Colletotrichum higginsianum]|uniref:Uncharacterized protein n=1 Tax=Colletotrichum higginsianum (strain IMI 349063) TaxID=759273 RepID=H1VPU3_COLHI|nr:hypothetical protein CH063_12300 [Colletotrichum higginsianum]
MCFQMDRCCGCLREKKKAKGKKDVRCLIYQSVPIYNVPVGGVRIEYSGIHLSMISILITGSHQYIVQTVGMIPLPRLCSDPSNGSEETNREGDKPSMAAKHLIDAAFARLMCMSFSDDSRLPSSCFPPATVVIRATVRRAQVGGLGEGASARTGSSTWPRAFGGFESDGAGLNLLRPSRPGPNRTEPNWAVMCCPVL